MLASRARSQLIVIDMQDKLLASIADAQSVLANTIRLIGFARRLGVPITVTEHYPAGLGATSAVLGDALGHVAQTISKLAFSAWREDTVRARLREQRQAGRDQVVLAGCETHVCVGQTALDLIANDFQVFVVADATASRRPQDRDIALQRMSRCGAALVTQEMVGFEWLERAGTPEFNDLLPLIKS